MAKPTTVAGYVASLPAGQQEIAGRLLPVVEEAFGAGVMFHGHPVWKVGGNPVVLVKAYGRYVTFGFWKGRRIEDASGRLEAGAREMASVKLHSSADVDAELFRGWLEQAAALEG
ncbi:DUF1801 domain-containing protein [Actinomadura kijaniata]|uniref:DUF1801 domain-containing protein n=1 Tax=Actinomadura kijaniata TaxID=46161 RepID=UPI003F19A502